MILRIFERVSNININKQVVRVVRVFNRNVPSGITASEFTQKGGILIGTGNGSFAEKAPGADGEVIVYDSGAATGVSSQVLASNYPPGFHYGLALSNNVSDANNDIDVATGSARDSTDSFNLDLAAIMTKRLDASWAVGSGNGGLDTGAKANSTWYHLWLIRLDSSGVLDVLFSTSSTAPTMPSGYTYKRRIGAIKTDGSGNIIAFFQIHRHFYWTTPILDYSTTTLTTTRVTTVLASVPTGYKVIAFCNVHTSNGTVAARVYLSNPNMVDLAPSPTVAPLSSTSNGGGGTSASTQERLITDTSGQVCARSTAANTTLYIATLGWYDFME